jgi:Winged helix DNA-binding domain
MAMWDSILLAYFDRSRIMPPDYRRLVTRSNGDVLPTLLVDGYVAGVWRPVEGGIEATAFRRLPEEAWEGLVAEARSLVAFLADREPQVYPRYEYWWRMLPRRRGSAALRWLKWHDPNGCDNPRRRRSVLGRDGGGVFQQAALGFATETTPAKRRFVRLFPRQQIRDAPAGLNG